MDRTTGGCLCGAVRYEFHAEPKHCVACHCRDCQYVSGGAPAYAMIMQAADVVVTRGTLKEFWIVSAGRNRIARLFCDTCGTPVFARNEKHPEFLPIRVGTLDDPSRFRIEANIWTQSAQPWHQIDQGVLCFKQNPEVNLNALFELVRSRAVRLGRATKRIVSRF